MCETRALRIEEAVKKISFDPCSIWGLSGRGLLRPGYAADVVVFDPATIDRGPSSRRATCRAPASAGCGTRRACTPGS